jgi:hypothetical protein
MTKLAIWVAALSVGSILPLSDGVAVANQACSAFTGAAGLGLDDGCNGAPPYFNPPFYSADLSYKNPNLLAPPGTAGSIFQNGQTVAPNLHDDNNPASSLVNWNVAGRDFAVGVKPGPNTVTYVHNGVPVTLTGAYCTGEYQSLDNPKLPCSHDVNGYLSPLIDAVTYDWAKDGQAGYANTGCESGVNWATTGAYPYLVQCVAGSQHVDVAGFDFGPAELNGGSYVPMCAGFMLKDADVNYQGGAGYTIAFENNRVFWSGDASCLVLPTEFQANAIQPIYLNINQTHQWTIRVWNNRFDQNAQNAYNTIGNPQFYGFYGPITIGQGSSRGIAQLEISVKYNFFSELFGRGVNLNEACGGFEFSYNVIQNIGRNSGGIHGQIYYFAVNHINNNVTAPYYQVIHCPNFTSPQYPPPPLTTWAGSTWGIVPYSNVINNTAWTDSTVEGSGTAFFNSGYSWSAPDLVNIIETRVSLNTLVANRARDLGGLYYFMFEGGYPRVNTSLGDTTGYNLDAIKGDILYIGTTQCAVNYTPYSRPPTFIVSGGSSIRVADQGNCGYEDPGTGTPTLYCLRCANHVNGFNTGWTVGVRFQWVSESRLLTVGGGGANSDGGLNGGFMNYENLYIDHNLLDGTGSFTVFTSYPTRFGKYISCSNGPIGSTLPSGSSFPFFSFGNGNAHVIGNINPGGSAVNSTDWARGTGC